ncbi:MAG TPA: efflux transporter outer membrane subunit [Xanthomonadaceae bacterium]|jgi:NodT family efflux transporter outer membrane factor (OMF) lipoprotein|nr:efflux transporter outer membrane subunit [Xanthomonadaceae bacterium]
MKDHRTVIARSITATTCLLLGACAVGPNYTKPEVEVPAAYKETAPQQQADAHASTSNAPASDWNRAQPADSLKRGAWWEVFGDPLLNQFEQQVEVSNQTLAQSEAQYRQARALVSGARAGYFPTVGVSASATRSKRGSGSGAGNSGSGGTGSGGNGSSGSSSSSQISDAYSLPLTASWEPDLWGKVRRTVEGDVASAQASAATLESTRLSLQAELAQDYLQLRITDEQKRLLDDTIVGYQRSLQLTQNQYNVGVAARADVVQAEVQLKGAQAQAIDLGIMRAQLEHAIALLVGKTPADVSIAVLALTIKPPPIPAGVPSELLQRRPDVAIAERQAAAANAQIGVAEAAYFPSLTLSGTAGYQSSAFSKLLTAPSFFWSVGPQLAETLFDGGARRAQTAQARAAYDAAVANYRETALAAFQNVEDNLAALRILENESAVEADAVKLAQESLKITLNQYRAGTVSYLNVVTAQATAYGDETKAITILGTQLNDSVALIKALGGGWQASELPAAGVVRMK